MQPCRRFVPFFALPLILAGLLSWQAPSLAQELEASSLPTGVLLTDGGPVLAPRSLRMPSLSARHVRVDEQALRAAIETEAGLTVDLMVMDLPLRFERWHSLRNRSGSISWIGRDPADSRSLMVLVHRSGVTVGSIRAHGELYMLYYAGRDRHGHLHTLYRVDESDPRFREDPPTEPTFESKRWLAAERLAQAKAAGDVAQDDGSIQDLMVVYTPAARDEAGGVVAIENLIDLGVTETNLSYENSGVNHRIRLVYKGLINYDESTPSAVDLRDRLQLTDDGHMDEVHPLRDQYAADLVKLVYAGGGCGRAFIMSEVSLAHAEFAFDRTNHICISPTYSFQHELGHVQGGRHSWVGDTTIDMPYPFNHGYRDIANEFHTIMATNWQQGCPDCTRLLYWSNPDLNEPVSGAPLGIADGQPQAADNRMTLNLTAWTVANFRVDTSGILSDDFEAGNLDKWSTIEPPLP